MRRIELTISLNYVPAWGLHEALRELYQNSIDRVNDMAEEGQAFNLIHKYYKKHSTLLIGNENTKLKIDTLVLGNTDKNSNQKKIGQFGEGYKLAIIVLLRMGLNVVIYNGDEIWKPAIEQSQNFECPVLAFYITEGNSKRKDLVFAVHGIPAESYEGYRAYNLHLQKPYQSETTSRGEILYLEEHRGKIFVEGLYICTMDDAEKFYYGYNFKAGVIELDRDRKKLSSVDVAWESKQMIKELSPDHDDEIIALMEIEASDLKYFVNPPWYNNEAVQRIGNRVYKKFRADYGYGFVPVGDLNRETALKKNYANVKVKYVSQKLAEVMEQTEAYQEDLRQLKSRIYIAPVDLLKKFLHDNKDYFTSVLLERFQEEIIRKAEKWHGEDYEDV